MVIIAHADDAEFGSAGTIAKWARQGMEITYVVITNGNKGSDDITLTSEQLSQLREREQRAACELLGVKEAVFLGYNDGELEPTLAVRRDLVRMIRRYKPDVAIVPDPATWYTVRGYINHPDHRAAGEAALAAIYPSARDRLMFPELIEEGLEPHKVREVYIIMTEDPNHWIDISEVMDTKIAALKEHRSQLKDPDAAAEMVRGWAELSAEGHEMKYAERFKRIVLPQ